MSTTNSTEILTMREYAKRHNVVLRTVYRWLANDDMPPDFVDEYRAGGVRRVLVLTMPEFADRMSDARPARLAREEEARQAAAFAE